jgi:hypothetical protein
MFIGSREARDLNIFLILVVYFYYIINKLIILIFDSY